MGAARAIVIAVLLIAQRMGVEANIAEGLIRRILPLVLDEGRRAVNFRGDGRVVIYDLSELPTYQLKTLYAEIILWRIYNEALRDRSHALRRLVVAEEEQNYVRPRRVDQKVEKGVCEYCGNDAYAKYPAGGIEIWLCEKCLDKYEQYYLMSRPSATWRDPITRRAAS